MSEEQSSLLPRPPMSSGLNPSRPDQGTCPMSQLFLYHSSTLATLHLSFKIPCPRCPMSQPFTRPAYEWMPKIQLDSSLCKVRSSEKILFLIFERKADFNGHLVLNTTISNPASLLLNFEPL